MGCLIQGEFCFIKPSTNKNCEVTLISPGTIRVSLLLSPASETKHSLIDSKSPWPDDKRILTEERAQTLLCPPSMSERVLNGNNVVKGTKIPRYVKITALFTFQVPYLEWISTEKTTAIKFHLEKPFIVRDMEPVWNFHGSALGAFGPIPDTRPSSQGAKMDLSKAANLNCCCRDTGFYRPASTKPWFTWTHTYSLRLCSIPNGNGSWAFPRGMEWFNHSPLPCHPFQC